MRTKLSPMAVFRLIVFTLALMAGVGLIFVGFWLLSSGTVAGSAENGTHTGAILILFACWGVGVFMAAGSVKALLDIFR